MLLGTATQLPSYLLFKYPTDTQVKNTWKSQHYWTCFFGGWSFSVTGPSAWNKQSAAGNQDDITDTRIVLWLLDEMFLRIATTRHNGDYKTAAWKCKFCKVWAELLLPLRVCLGDGDVEWLERLEDRELLLPWLTLLTLLLPAAGCDWESSLLSCRGRRIASNMSPITWKHGSTMKSMKPMHTQYSKYRYIQTFKNTSLIIIYISLQNTRICWIFLFKKSVESSLHCENTPVRELLTETTFNVSFAHLIIFLLLLLLLLLLYYYYYYC